MTDRELMQMALDAMESFESGTNGLYKGEFAEERKALRDRLAQPEYDQAALELCGVCGWKAVVPDECCLNCKRIAQPEPWVKTYCGGRPNYTTQPETFTNEPIAWMCEANDWDTWKPSLCWVKAENKCFRNWKPLYTAPKGWVGLTDEDFSEMVHIKLGDGSVFDSKVFAKNIEAKLKERNT